jgi:hypothetical protein
MAFCSDITEHGFDLNDGAVADPHKLDKANTAVLVISIGYLATFSGLLVGGCMELNLNASNHVMHNSLCHQTLSGHATDDAVVDDQYCTAHEP